MELVSHLTCWFEKKLTNTGIQFDTLAYVVGVLSKFEIQNDMSNESIVLAFHDAKFNKGDFSSFQKIGDWVLWANTFHPTYIKNNADVTYSIGRLSYYACHRILQKKWPLYEELADQLPKIVNIIKVELHK